jgi:hypothetical protein
MVIVDFAAGLPDLTTAEARRLRNHDEGVARLQGNWRPTSPPNDQVHAEVLHMSAMLSDGIIRQFSTRF